MIRLGTVFSGIGAIEHALLRMNVDHKLVFACDNGDVDVLSKRIEPVLSKIRNEISELEKGEEKVNASNDAETEYYKQYYVTLAEIKHRLEKLSASVPQDYSQQKNNVLAIINDVIDDSNVNKRKRDEYFELKQNISSANQSDDYYSILSALVIIIRDYKKNNELSALDEEATATQFSSNDSINWEKYYPVLKQLYSYQETVNAKRIIKEIRDIAERIGMIHEKIKTFEVLSTIKPMDYPEKKQYVDKLYEDKLNQNNVRKSYLANYKLDPKDFHWNVSFLDGTQYKGKVDLFVGGSPCQSFSLVGKQRGLEDTRGTLFYEFARLVKEIEPKVFIYENVKALLTNDEGRTWETIKSVFNDLGYQWEYSVLNAKNYGIPQNRERVFVVGIRNDLAAGRKYIFPEPIPLKLKMSDLLLDKVSDVYTLPPKGIEFVTNEKNLSKRYTQINGDVALCQKKNQQFNWHGDFVFEQTKSEDEIKESLERYFLSDKVREYVLSTGTKSFVSRPKTDLDIARPLLTTMHKMHRAGVDNYVTSFGRLRKLTPRECLRLMGFSDSFKIEVCDTSMYQQAGNSIVVDVLIHVMDNIFKCFEGIFDDAGKK